MASMQTYRLASIGWTLLCSMGCAAEMGDERVTVEDDEATVEVEQRLEPGDPSYDTTLPRTCTWTLTCSGVKARMRWGMTGNTGADCWSTAPSNMPLVMILHGHGYVYSEYAYLQSHLARNGFVSASINVVADPSNAPNHQQTAQAAIDYLRSACFQNHFVNNFSVPNPVDKQHFAVVGHSRGGETARFVAWLLAGAADFDVQAVVALAPTRHTTLDILGTQSMGYLLLYGTSDPDVPAQSAFGAFDQAGNNEWNTPSSFDLYKSMKLFQGGNHAGFTDGTVLDAGQRSTAKGYILAFLSAHLKSDFGYYNDYVRGDDVPGTFSSSLYSQYSDATARRVIDNAQRNTLTPSTIGGTVTTSGIASITLESASLALGTPHDTKLLVVSPNGTNPYVRWEIPAGTRNVSVYKYLSLRLGQLSGAAGTDIRVGLTNGRVQTFVRLSDYNAIPQPLTMCTQGGVGFGCSNSESLAHMRTFRIPLSDFGAHNDVRSVRLRFAGNTGNGRTFIVDNVEFSELVFII